MKDVFDQLDRARWVEHYTGFLAEVVDARQDAMEMDGRGRFGMDEEVIGTGLGKIREVALRLGDHQVYVERPHRATPHGFDDQRSDRDARHKATIHHVDVDPIRARGIDGPNFLAKTLKVR
jgi:hypothetical protein